MSGSKVDERSDLYSLAAVAFETITGRGVTLENDVAHIFYDILRNPAPLVSSLVPNTPRSVDDAFAAALSREPRERPASANQWIETFVADVETMASDVPGWEFGETAQSLEGRVTRPFGHRG